MSEHVANWVLASVNEVNYSAMYVIRIQVFKKVGQPTAIYLCISYSCSSVASYTFTIHASCVLPQLCMHVWLPLGQGGKSAVCGGGPKQEEAV